MATDKTIVDFLNQESPKDSKRVDDSQEHSSSNAQHLDSNRNLENIHQGGFVNPATVGSVSSVIGNVLGSTATGGAFTIAAPSGAFAVVAPLAAAAAPVISSIAAGDNTTGAESGGPVLAFSNVADQIQSESAEQTTAVSGFENQGAGELGIAATAAAPAILTGDTTINVAENTQDIQPNAAVLFPSTQNNTGSDTVVSDVDEAGGGGTLLAPTLSVANISGAEGSEIPLDITVASNSIDLPEETITVTISGIPNDAVLSAGVDNGDGSWTLTSEQLNNLTITAPTGVDTYNLSAIATSFANGESESSASTNFIFEVTEGDDGGTLLAPTLSVANISGAEGNDIPLDIAVISNSIDLPDEAITVTINGVPDDATLSAGVDNGDGSWTLTSEQLNDLTISTPTGVDTYNLSAIATSFANGESESSGISSFTFDVTAGGDVIMGTDGKDTLVGTQYSDTIYGLEDKDTINAGEGDDIVYGGGDKDTIYGESGDDILYGGEGHDKLYGGAGDDILYGGEGKDILMGGEGDDILYSGSGNDNQVYGEEGNDTFVFAEGDGKDAFTGGTGDWTDTVRLEGMNQGPTAQANDPGSWVLETNNSYTIDTDHNTIEFDQADASGTITLADGSELSFSQVEKIEW